jgi:hypothetical protein
VQNIIIILILLPSQMHGKSGEEQGRGGRRMKDHERRENKIGTANKQIRSHEDF